MPALCLDGARDVPLRDVGNFVCNDAGQLRLVGGGGDQAVVHADEPAGQREGVDVPFADHEEREALLRILNLGCDLAAKVLDVVGDLWVLENQPLIAQPAHHHQAELVLVVDRQGGIGPGADVRQIVRALGEGGRRAQRQQGQQGGAED